MEKTSKQPSIYEAVVFLFESQYNGNLEVTLNDEHIDALKKLSTGGKLRVKVIPEESRKKAAAVVEFASKASLDAFKASKSGDSLTPKKSSVDRF